MENDVKNKKNPANENSGAKKGLSTTSVVSIIVLLAVGIIAFTLYSREHKKLLTMMEDQKVSLTDKITARDSVINEWIMTFDDIEKNIAIIKEKEKIISLNSSNSEISVDKRQQVLEDIKYINTLLEQNKKKIASLNAQLKKSGGTIKSLQDKITGLEATMKQNEAEISELKSALLDKKFEVEQLNTQMTILNDTLAKKDEKIATQINELNKAFYVVGTFKELKEKGLIAKEGGFIGLGKTKSLTGNIPENVFTQIDITKAKYILIDSKNAKLISEHPAGSYEIVRDENKIVKTLDIKDPAQFWKVSKYAVVEITK
jgi:uncharacterized coiled-coil protein SlyX